MENIDFGQWAAGLYSREVKGKGVYDQEEQNGIPVEIPLGFTTPETLEQQISRLVRAYTAETGQEVESIEEANDFRIPGEDEDYEEDDYVVDNMEQAVVNTLPRSLPTEASEEASTPAEAEESPADSGKS